MNDAANPVIEFLLGRRSTVARLLGEPGPDGSELELILTAGARVPDHGKLAPWRFVIIRGQAREALGEAMAEVFKSANPETGPERLDHERGLALRAPVIVTVISKPVRHPKIPIWEQELSAGAVCHNVLAAAIALGYGAQWVTEWWAFDEGAARVLGLKRHERIAGFIHIGSHDEPLEDRRRPVMDDIVSEWTAEP
ncbi:Nitroreductase family protein [hydrothermal vent metagenome]|uniref:Nitroreductase family protein n=1 Tax=hydrothermal vent metagenome TaxID=652676 RepID=A0A3B0U0I3_9ZZZZ